MTQPLQPNRESGDASRITTTDTPELIIEAAERVLRDVGFAHASTRRVADEAGVPLSQIHYHFGSKQKLMLALLEHQNDKLVDRQATMYGADAPLWRQWEQACDFYDEDLASGYVRVLQEMTAAGWSDPEIGEAVRSAIREWHGVLREVAERAQDRFGSFGALSAPDIATLVSVAWLGAESMHLLGMESEGFDPRGALRRFGTVLRALEEGSAS